MASRDGRFIRLAVFRLCLFTAAPVSVLFLSLNAQAQQHHVPLAVYFVLAIAGVFATNIDIRLSDSVSVLPYHGVMVASIVLIPSQPWFSIGVVGICCAANFTRLTKRPLYATLNCTFNLASGCI